MVAIYLPYTYLIERIYNGYITDIENIYKCILNAYTKHIAKTFTHPLTDTLIPH